MQERDPEVNTVSCSWAFFQCSLLYLTVDKGQGSKAAEHRQLFRGIFSNANFLRDFALDYYNGEKRSR